mgnify:CR=1 FL=1
MNGGLLTFKSFASSLKGLFHDAFPRLGELSVVNILLLFVLALVVVVDIVGNSLLAAMYVFFDGFGQVFFGKLTIHTSVDITPFWLYMLFLGGGFLLCLFIVKKHLSGKLW